jgi:hypothetical protein
VGTSLLDSKAIPPAIPGLSSGHYNGNGSVNSFMEKKDWIGTLRVKYEHDIDPA